MSINEIKIEEKTKYLKHLTLQYQEAHKKLKITDNKTRVNEEINQLSDEMDKVNNELENLRNSSKSKNNNYRSCSKNWDEKIPKIDFKKSKNIIKNIITKFQEEEAKEAIFLLQDSYSKEGRFLIQYMKSAIQGEIKECDDTCKFGFLDLDFPNDLLTVLDREQEFTIPETNEIIKPTPGNEPIVIITSNKEKGNLPAPFLRRCIYYFVPFPNNTERLQEIVNAHYHNQKDNSPKIPPSTKLVEAAAEKFLEIRNAGGLFKNPGTSEFLDWIEALQNFASKPFTASELKQSKRIIFPELLFKLRADLQKYVA